MTNLFFSTNMQGIVSSLFLGKDVLTNWKIFPLNIDGAISGGWPHSDSHSYNLQKDPSSGPTFYSGTLQPNGVARDTFLMLSKWTKVVFKVFFYSVTSCLQHWLYYKVLLVCNRARFGSMVKTWDGTGQRGDPSRLFMFPGLCSAPTRPTTSQCWSWRVRHPI